MGNGVKMIITLSFKINKNTINVFFRILNVTTHVYNVAYNHINHTPAHLTLIHQPAYTWPSSMNSNLAHNSTKYPCTEPCQQFVKPRNLPKRNKNVNPIEPIQPIAVATFHDPREMCSDPASPSLKKAANWQFDMVIPGIADDSKAKQTNGTSRWRKSNQPSKRPPEAEALVAQPREKQSLADAPIVVAPDLLDDAGASKLRL